MISNLRKENNILKAQVGSLEVNQSIMVDRDE
jgi:hypothetical protein